MNSRLLAIGSILTLSITQTPNAFAQQKIEESTQKAIQTILTSPAPGGGIHGSIKRNKPDKTTTAKFEPQRLCVGVFEIDTDGVLAQMACYELTYATLPAKSDRLKIANWIYDWTKRSKPFNFPTSAPISAGQEATRISQFDLFFDNISKSGFGDQSDLFLYCAGSNMAFFDLGDMDMTLNFSSEGVGHVKKDLNNSFIKPEFLPGVSVSDKVLYLENWFYDEKGKTIKNTPGDGRIYSFNVGVTLKNRAGNVAGVIYIDPETGNGGGRP